MQVTPPQPLLETVPCRRQLVGQWSPAKMATITEVQQGGGADNACNPQFDRMCLIKFDGLNVETWNQCQWVHCAGTKMPQEHSGGQRRTPPWRSRPTVGPSQGSRLARQAPQTARVLVPVWEAPKGRLEAPISSAVHKGGTRAQRGSCYHLLWRPFRPRPEPFIGLRMLSTEHHCKRPGDDLEDLSNGAWKQQRCRQYPNQEP